MLIKLGARAPSEDLVDLLLSCHARIRSFVGVAEAISARQDLPDAEVREACASCERYFSEALPLHVEDEERSLLPRLAGLRDEVDQALSTMHAQHEAHVELVSALVHALVEVRTHPGDAGSRALLRAAAASARSAFDEHLTLEETVIFPAARELLPEVSAEAVRELRARRRPA
jgi:iron-sulfur cluster repair protein YtfE (RIC family)